MKDYWSIRSKKYDKLNWVNNEILLDRLVNFGNFLSTDKVLDLGCGTGVLCRKLAPIVDELVAIDSSRDMLRTGKFPKTVTKFCINLEEADCTTPNDYFTKIVSRMVFHHLKDRKEMLIKCKDMLAPDGWMIIEEGGVYEDPYIRNWYSKMMRLKEKRHDFTLTELERLYMSCGFKNITLSINHNDNFSVGNWLQSSGQPKALCNKIWNMHKNAPQRIKEFYNMKETEDDILLTTNVVFIKGRKPC